MKKQIIKQHEDKYLHILKLALLPLLGLIVFILLAYGNYFLIDNHVVSYALNCKEDCSKLVTHDLLDIYPIMGEYILIALAFISLVAMFKRGYRNLKSYNEEGLIWGLIGGLIWGLIWGLIAELQEVGQQ